MPATLRPATITMNAWLDRGVAALAWPSYAVARLARAILWFAPRRVPWALIVAGLLALGAWRAYDAGRAIIDAQPRPQPVGLADVVDSRATGWVGTSSIVRGPFLDSTSYGAPVQRWYYLLLDPSDPGVAMIARSTERLEERRTRTIAARVETDPAAVRAALTGLEEGVRVDPDRYLVELPDRPGALTGEAVASPAGRGLDASRVVLRGSFDQARRATDGDGWEYVVSDGRRGVIVRSPHPPDALPVDVWGVLATDAVRTPQAAAVPDLRAELGDRRMPDRRLLAEGISPPITEPSPLPAMVLAAIGAIVAFGWLHGYPDFRRRMTPHRISTWPLAPGDELAADLYGTDDRDGRQVVVDGAPARLAPLAADELDRRSWQFALREAPAPVHAGIPSGPAPAALALSSGEGPILVRLDPPPSGLRIASGRLAHAGLVRAAIRLRAAGLDLVAAFPSEIDRDRAIAAIDPGRRGAVPDGPPPSGAPARVAATATDGMPVPLLAAAAVFAAVGGLMVTVGGVGLPAGAGDAATALPSLLQLAVGAGVLAVARGIWLRRGWAEGIGFTVGWVGASIAAFLVVAAPQCGLWLAPNLTACRAAGPVGSAAALGAAIGLGYAALAIRRHASAFVR